MSTNFDWEPKQSPNAGSEWLDDDLGDVMSLLDKDYAPAKPKAPQPEVVYIPDEDSMDDLDFIKFILDRDSARDRISQEAAAQAEPLRMEPAPVRTANRSQAAPAAAMPKADAQPMPKTAPVHASFSAAEPADDLADIMGLLDRDYSKPQPRQTAPVHQAPTYPAAPVRQAPVHSAPVHQAATGHKAPPVYTPAPKAAPSDDLADIMDLLDRDYSKPQPPKARTAAPVAPGVGNGGSLDDMDFIPGFDDFPAAPWDAPVKMEPIPPKSGKGPRNPKPVKSDPSTAVRRGKDKLLGVLIGTAAGQALIIALVWTLWLLL